VTLFQHLVVDGLLVKIMAIHYNQDASILDEFTTLDPDAFGPGQQRLQSIAGQHGQFLFLVSMGLGKEWFHLGGVIAEAPTPPFDPFAAILKD
jgi:hypothetical protein